jgi:hypothetical protein
LSNAGVVIKILKLAIGAIPVWLLLFGIMYGSEGVTETLFAKSVLGGKLNVDQTPLFVRAVARVPRKTLIAAISQPMN